MTPAPAAPAQSASFALTLLFGINLMNFFDRMILPAVTEPVRREWSLSDTQIGWLTTGFTLIYAAAGVPLGRLADRWNRKWLLALGVAVWSLLTAASGMAMSFWMLFLIRLGVGIGEATCAPAANSLIGDLFEPHRRGRAISIFMLGLPAGVFLSFYITGPLAREYGWRVPFYLACLPGLVLALLILKLREPERGLREGQSSPNRAGHAAWRSVLRIPAMWWIIGSGIFFNFNGYAVSSFLTALLMRGYEMDLRSANKVSAVVLGALTAAGLLAGGWAGDRVHRWRKDGRLLLAGTGMLVASAFVFVALRQPMGAKVPFIALLGMGMMFSYFYYGPVYATIQDLIEPRLRGTAMALYFFGMYVLGASFGSVGLGALSDYCAQQAMQAAGATELETFRAAGLHRAMYIVPLLALLASGTLFAAARAVRRTRPLPAPTGA